MFGKHVFVFMLSKIGISYKVKKLAGAHLCTACKPLNVAERRFELLTLRV